MGRIGMSVGTRHLRGYIPLQLDLVIPIFRCTVNRFTGYVVYPPRCRRTRSSGVHVHRAHRRMRARCGPCAGQCLGICRPARDTFLIIEQFARLGNGSSKLGSTGHDFAALTWPHSCHSRIGQQQAPQPTKPSTHASADLAPERNHRILAGR